MYLDYLTECTRPGSATRCVLLPAYEEGTESVRCLAAALPSAYAPRRRRLCCALRTVRKTSLDLNSGAEATFGELFDEAVELLFAALVAT